jgi:hypothetical protein
LRCYHAVKTETNTSPTIIKGARHGRTQAERHEERRKND